MKTLPADKFFNDINFVSIIDTIKGVYMSDGAMSTLLDFERVMDEADVYAFKNWIIGELVQGPVIGRYNAKCVFMWPYKLMPDPRGALRLTNIGCEVKFAKSSIKVPVEVEVPVEKEVYVTDDSHVKDLSEKISKLEEERDSYKKDSEHFQKLWNDTLHKLELEQSKNKRDI
jgi:hypothetical protein